MCSTLGRHRKINSHPRSPCPPFWGQNEWRFGQPALSAKVPWPSGIHRAWVPLREGLVIPAGDDILPGFWRLETHLRPFFSLGNNNNKARLLSWGTALPPPGRNGGGRAFPAPPPTATTTVLSLPFLPPPPRAGGQQGGGSWENSLEPEQRSRQTVPGALAGAWTQNASSVAQPPVGMR